jgi:hypothetical protein
VFIPSLQRDVYFKPLSLQQQKEILKAGISSEIFNILEFNIILTNIIDQNSLEKYDFNLNDRAAIAIGLRSKFTTQPLELEDEKIDISSLASKTIAYDSNAFDEFVVEEGVVKLIAQTPSLRMDQAITKIQLARIKKTSSDNLPSIIGDMYIFEIAKYIQKLEIGEISQDLSLISFDEKLKIVEQLPASIITNLNKIINKKFKEPEDAYLTIGDKKISIDARLFV